MQDREEIMREIGLRLRAAREASFPPRSQADLAIQFGVSLRQYQRWEKGNSLPEWDRLQVVARELGVELGDLVTGPVQVASRDSASVERIVDLLEEIAEKLDAKRR